MSAARLFSSCLAALLLASAASAHAQAKLPVKKAFPVSTDDGVYGRFDGDLDLGLALGAEFGAAGHAAPLMRGSAHYFAMAGAYVQGRPKVEDRGPPSLLGIGVDLRPLFVPRWAKGYERGPGFLDLTLDSLSLSLGAFWAAPQHRPFGDQRGFEAGFGFGVPLFVTGPGLWLEARGTLRYPDDGQRQEAVLIALAYHTFVSSPWLGSD